MSEHLLITLVLCVIMIMLVVVFLNHPQKYFDGFKKGHGDVSQVDVLDSYDNNRRKLDIVPNYSRDYYEYAKVADYSDAVKSPSKNNNGDANNNNSGGSSGSSSNNSGSSGSCDKESLEYAEDDRRELLMKNLPSIASNTIATVAADSASVATNISNGIVNNLNNLNKIIGGAIRAPVTWFKSASAYIPFADNLDNVTNNNTTQRLRY